MDKNAANEGPVDEELQKQLEDQELEDLLDSALGDFDKVPKQAEKKEEKNERGGDVWGSEFEALEAEEGIKLMEQKMKELFAGMGEGAFGGGDMDEDLKKIADEANKYFTESVTRDPDLTDKLSEALKDLTSNVENIKSQLNPESLASMFGGLQVDDSSSQNDFLPFMHNMMQMFLSKEVFYPPLKEVCGKFPAWLEREKDNLTETEFQNYSKQLKLMENVCSEFEDEKADDSEDTKKDRFTKILSLMDEIQKLGLLPQEFTEQNPLQNLEELGLPSNMPNLPPGQCALM